MDGYLGNYIRMHRKRANLSERELAQLLGSPDAAPVSRQERSRSLPPLLIALAYSEIFGTPVSKLFAGVHETVQLAVKSRLAELETRLQQSQGGLQAAAVAHKLEWLNQHPSPRNSPQP